MSSSSHDPGPTTGPRIIQWLLDTRPLWRVPAKANPTEEVQALKIVAARALALLPESEQTAALKFYHLRDAKSSLASNLLKRLIVAKYSNVPWSAIQITRDENGKPQFMPENGTCQTRIDLNVSHQAGVVSLFAAVGFNQKIDVGTDIVCWTERLKHDYTHIDTHGFFDWIDIHADVFSESEINVMKLGPVSEADLGISSAVFRGYAKDAVSRCERRNTKISLDVQDESGVSTSLQVESNLIIEAKLKRFYAMWCLREAYVKMTSEALLAPWLKDLDIENVRVPKPKAEDTDVESSQEADASDGQTPATIPGVSRSLIEGSSMTDFEIYLKEKKEKDVTMVLSALGPDYMVGSALRRPSEVEGCLDIGPWVHLDIDTDIISFAEARP